MRRRPLPQKSEANESSVNDPEQYPGETRRFEFETYTRTTFQGKIPFLTLEGDKRISVNSSACRLFGEPEAVELLFDPKRRTIGLRPASLTAPNSFKIVHRTNKGAKKAYGFTVSAFAFFKHYGIGMAETTRYPVEIYDGMLISDLNNPL